MEVDELSRITKHQPLRTCVGCGVRRPNRELMRLVLAKTGRVIFDPAGDEAGRGCHLCPRSECLNTALQRRAFQRAFRRSLPEPSTAHLLDSFPQQRKNWISAQPLRKRVDWITHALEAFFAEPRWQGPEDPLDILILTVLSQSTNDRNRDAAYQRLRTAYPTWDEVLQAPVTAVADAIRPAGLANQKSGRIQDILRWVKDTHGSLVLDFCDRSPDEVQQTFLQLKGVGIKTISVVLMVCCGADVFPVDTHVHRLCQRLGLVPQGISAEKTHDQMQPLVPGGKSYSLHMNFLHLGRTICQARIPHCEKCPIAIWCPAAQPF